MTCLRFAAVEFKDPLAELDPVPVREWTTWDIPSLTMIDTARRRLLIVRGRENHRADAGDRVPGPGQAAVMAPLQALSFYTGAHS